MRQSCSNIVCRPAAKARDSNAAPNLETTSVEPKVTSLGSVITMQSPEFLPEVSESGSNESALAALFDDAYNSVLGQPSPADKAGNDSRRTGSKEAQEDTQKYLKAPEVHRDDSGRPREYTTPAGNQCEIAYGEDGKLNRVTITPPTGRPEVLERTEKGWWKVNGVTDYELTVKVLDDGSVVRENKMFGGSLVTRPDGTAEGRDRDERRSLVVEADGTRSTYRYDGSITSFGTRLIEKPGSKFAEIKSTYGDFNEGYQYTHNGGHIETLQRVNREWELHRNGVKEVLPRGTHVEIKPDGYRKISRPDGSSIEGLPDGITLDRNRNEKIARLSSPDGLVTTLQYDEKGKVKDVQVHDNSGKLLEHSQRTANGWDSTITDAAGKPLVIKGVEVDQKTGKYALNTFSGRISRLPDGTEDQTDAYGRKIEGYDDKVMSWMKKSGLELSKEEKKTLEADLAVLNKLPAEKKSEILFSLDRIVNGNCDNKTELSKSQRAEIVASLAHQIAHPDSISQGGKRAASMASAERILAATRPEEYARMVSQLAIDGKFTTGDGKLVEVQRGPYGFLDGKTDSYNQRSLTSELFQNAAANLALSGEGLEYRSYSSDSSKLEPRPFDVDPSLDSGERVKDRDGRIRSFHGLTAEQRAVLLKDLGIDHTDAGVIKSEKELLAAWENRTDKNAPLTIAIGVDQKVGYFTEQWKRAPEVDPQHHIITITHIDTSGIIPVVYFDNTAGGEDHSYPNGTPLPAGNITMAQYQMRQGIVPV